MSFDLAIRLTEILLALALIQQCFEHIGTYRNETVLFLLRLALSLLLISGVHSDFAIWGILGLSLLILHRFQGPYNGGSDRMTLLILIALSLVHLFPDAMMAELAFAYLAFQLVMSYFVSGWVKLRNADWRNGTALADVFRFSAYPISERLRDLANAPRHDLAGIAGRYRLRACLSVRAD